MEAHDILEEFETNLVPRVVADSSLVGFRLRFLWHRRRAHQTWEKIPGRGKAGEENNNMEQTASSLRGLHYHMTHNLRAPLRAIQGFSHELQTNFGSALGEEGHELLRRINDSSVRMEKLVRSYQDYVELSHRDFVWRSVSLGKLIHSVASRMADEFEARKPDIEVRPEFPELWTCPALVDEALTQLCRNALTYVLPERIPHAKIWAEDNQSHVDVFVKDNGIGVASEYQEKVFVSSSASPRGCNLRERVWACRLPGDARNDWADESGWNHPPTAGVVSYSSFPCALANQFR